MADSLLSQRRMLTRSPRDKEGNRIRGLGIRSAEEAAAEQEYMGRYAAGMAELQRRSMLSALRESEMRPGQPGTQEQKQPAPLSARDQLAKDRESRMAYYARINGRTPAAAAGQTQSRNPFAKIDPGFTPDPNGLGSAQAVYRRSDGYTGGEPPTQAKITPSPVATTGQTPATGGRDMGPVILSPDGTITKKDPRDPNKYFYDKESDMVVGTMMDRNRSPQGSTGGKPANTDGYGRKTPDARSAQAVYRRSDEKDPKDPNKYYYDEESGLVGTLTARNRSPQGSTGGEPATNGQTPPATTGIPRLLQRPPAAEPAPVRSRYRDQLDELTAKNEVASQRAAMTERVMQGGSAALQEEINRVSGRPTRLEMERLRRGPAAPAQGETLAQMRASTQSLLRMPRPQNPSDQEGYPNLPPTVQGSKSPSTPTVTPTAAPAAPAAPSLLRGGTTREDAQKRVDAARASGTLPSYQDRMIAGGITIDDMKSGVGSLMSGAGSLLKKARAGVDRTNAWADSVRNRINK